MTTCSPMVLICRILLLPRWQLLLPPCHPWQLSPVQLIPVHTLQSAQMMSLMSQPQTVCQSVARLHRRTTSWCAAPAAPRQSARSVTVPAQKQDMPAQTVTRATGIAPTLGLGVPPASGSRLLFGTAAWQQGAFELSLDDLSRTSTLAVLPVHH